MARRTTALAATGSLAAAALLLTACGGGGSDSKITSSPAAPTTSAPATSAPATTPAAADGPTFDFPSDVKVVVDPDTTGDATKDAILKDQAYGEQAIFLAIAKLDPKLPQLQTYVGGDALQSWIDKVKWGQSHHRSVTGTTQFYQRTVHVTGSDTANVTFCESERAAYDKDTTTGRTIKTTPSPDDFTQHLAMMQKGSDGVWKMTTYQSQKGAKACQR
ncbi:hypothetical protein [Actinacidiphila guanduensis]|uniref:Lipoprotein n=1 Tax=Actinacidiphila guanduensis TaxID=310781 RepID=A0A1G9ZVR5_9ACTN|nr:hypothetical protein [Actinacidiphila guanduensis]SDN25328.1 hypothetical protein SAMN05216259_103314 [Actinacidiphila guanduensis]